MSNKKYRNLPPSMRQDATDLEAMVAGINAGAGSAVNATPPTPDPPPSDPPPGNPDSTPPDQPPLEPATPPDPQPSGADDRIDPDTGLTWREKATRLQGKLAAETQRFNDELDARDSTIATLTHQLAVASRQPAAPPPAPAAPLQMPEALRDSLGPHADALQTFVEQAVTARVQPVQAATAEEAQRRFVAELAEKVPDFMQLNKEPGFVKWCFEPDEFGRVPQDAFNVAANNKDAKTCAAIYAAYKRSIAPPAAAPQAPPPGTPPPAQRAPLSQRVTPGASPTGTPAPTAQKPTFKASEYAYVEKQLTENRNHWTRNDPAKLKEFRKQFDEMQRAALEGRIVPG